MKTYDLIVIGSGSGGAAAARYAARLGARVAIVEKSAQKMGGDSLRTGTVPSKALIHISRIEHPTWVKARRHITRTIERIEQSQDNPAFYAQAGIDVIFGTAQLASEYGDVKVGKQSLRTKRIIVATGSTPFVPNVPGLKQSGYETSESLFELPKMPRRLVIVGGGPMACEMASAFSKMGSQVTILEHNPRILTLLDDEAAERVEASLVERGVSVMTSASIIKVEAKKRQKILDIRYAGEKLEIKADTILIAAGRKANYPAGLADAGILTGDNGILVDNRWRTSNKKVYAVGDVTNMPCRFAHVAAMAGAQAALHSVLGMPSRGFMEAQPFTFFTDPQVAQAGATQMQLERDGIEHRVYIMPFSDIDKAIAEEQEGFIKLVISPRGKVLGGTIVGQGAGELIGYIAQAIDKKQPLPALMSLLLPYPTLGLGIRQLAVEAHFDLISRYPRPIEYLRALLNLR